MIQTGNRAAMNGLIVQNDSIFWEYVQKGTVYQIFFPPFYKILQPLSNNFLIPTVGFGTGSKLMLGPAHLTYSLGSDIHSFITKNMKYSSTDLPPSDTLIRSLAMGKIKVCTSTLFVNVKNSNFSTFF